MNIKFYVGNKVYEKVEDYMDLENFYSKAGDWVSQDKSKWNLITLMAYFCTKYESLYGVRYKILSWKGDPGRTKEARDLSKILKQLSVPNNEWEDKKENKRKNIIKVFNYINWMFDYKFRNKNINSTGLLLNGGLLNEFERAYNKKIKEHKEKSSTKDILSWMKINTPNIIDDYQVDSKNNIDIFIKFIETNNVPEDTEEYKLYKYIKESLK